MLSPGDGGYSAKLIDFGLALELDPELPLVTERKKTIVGGKYRVACV